MKTEPSLALNDDLERKIIRLVAQGFRNREIAEKLGLSERTANEYIEVVYDTFGVCDRLELVLYGIKHGFIAPAASEVLFDRKVPGATVAAHGE
jgi:DNA-binding NarL/FixJ family response regulator